MRAPSTTSKRASAGRFLEQDASVFSDTMQLNYMGTVNVLKAALPGMVRRGEGHIVVVASVMAIIGVHDATLIKRQ
jgi:3-dehydrosphinganine reductase